MGVANYLLTEMMLDPPSAGGGRKFQQERFPGFPGFPPFEATKDTKNGDGFRVLYGFCI